MSETPVPASAERVRAGSSIRMSLLMYGIVEAHGRPFSGWGLGGRPLRAVTDGPVLAIVTEHGSADPLPTTAAVLAYERVIRQLMGRGAILPARYGTVLADDDAVRAFLHWRRDDLVRRLHHIDGAVEIGLRASWQDDAQPSSDLLPQCGTSYLRDRQERRQSARRVAHELDPLTELARGAKRVLAPRPDLPVLDAYLVDRRRVKEFLALVEQLDGQLDDVDLVCTGPWPPYSFAEGTSI